MIVLQFLTKEFLRVLSFNYLSIYTSALRNYLPDTVLNSHVNQKITKGMFRLRLLKTKYAIWSVQILLEFLENISLDNDMDVSRKFEVFLRFLSGSCIHIISKLKTTNTYLTDDEWTFIFDKLLRHARPSMQEKPLVFLYFPKNPKLGSVTKLRIEAVLNIRSMHSSDTVLLITAALPYKGVSSDTIARWIKQVYTHIFFCLVGVNLLPLVKHWRVKLASQQH